MKKIQSLKLMLLGLLALGSSNAFAQGVGDQIEDENYFYTVTKASELKNNVWTVGEVELTSLKPGKSTMDANKKLIFPAQVQYASGATKTYNVTTMAPDVFRDNSYDVQTAEIPATLKEIPTGAFNTLGHLHTLTFAADSQVKKIGTQAFASTQITTFDFSPCEELEGLMDGVFVQTTTETADNRNVNGNITTVILPTSTNFKHINGAFRNLTALTTITNLENSWIRELVDDAFSGCESLLELNLPGNDLQYISSKALEGSVIKKLSVNAGTGATNGNPMKLLGGCTVDYVYDDVNQEYVYNYEGDKYTTAVEAYNEGKEESEQHQAVAWGPADAATNLYGLDGDDEETAPLINLTISGKLQGKICKNAFAWCSDINNEDAEDDEDGIEAGISLAGIQFGTMAQIQEHAFLDDENIDALTIGDIKDNRLAGQAYTIDQNAFEGCPIADLTIGNIETANAIGSAAFGIDLINVTIGTVKAGAAAFAGGTKTIAEIINPQDGSYDNSEGVLGAFVWKNTTGTTLKIAQSTTTAQYLSSDNPDEPDVFVIPAGVFDFSAVGSPLAAYPEIWIGTIASEGGVFATGAIVGTNVDKLHFTGDIEANGLQYAILDNGFEQDASTFAISLEDGDEDIVEDNVEDAFESEEAAKDVYDPENPNPEDLLGSWVKTGDAEYKQIVSVIYENDEVTLGYAKKPKEYSEEEIVETGGVIITEVTSTEDEGNFIASATEGKYNKIETVEETQGEITYTNRLSELTFAGKLKSSAIGEGAFANFTSLETLEFHGLMSKEAVVAGAFTNTGKEDADGIIGSETDPFVVYDADLTDNDASENPFASAAFGTADDERVIWWSVANDKLAASILGAIQIDVQGEAEDGKTYNPKFNVYKWVAKLAEPEPAPQGFIVFTDNKVISLDGNTNPKLAWGRYDLGSFENEKGIFYDPLATDEDIEANPEKAGYQKTDMLITRFMKADGEGLKATGVTTGNKYNVKLTLYGVYWDQDPFAEQSSVYMVPLQVIDGQYQISENNTHLIIAKVENLDGDFADDQILIDYDMPDADDDDDVDDGSDDNNDPQDPAAGDGDDDDDDEFDPEDYITAWGGNSVWDQLQEETLGEGPSLDTPRVFVKADHSWMNQELVDFVKNEGGVQNIGVAPDGTLVKDLYAMLNPAANAGFDVKRFPIERKTDGTGAYIGKNWYYALLKNYYNPATTARIIWLGEDEATAIFGVKGVDVKEALHNNGTIYNMQGIRVNKASKGVYIKDGQKYVVK